MSTDAKSRIVEAAVKLFTSRPYARVSVDDVAREAGVSKGAVFHYFKSKAELAEEALKEYAKHRAKEALRELDEAGSVGRWVEALATSLVSAGTEERERLLYLMEAYAELRVEGRGAKLAELARGLVEALAERLEAMGVAEAKVKAELVAAAIDGLHLHASLNPALLSGDEARRLVELLRRLVEAP